jgi:hypothetical protein
MYLEDRTSGQGFTSWFVSSPLTGNVHTILNINTFQVMRRFSTQRRLFINRPWHNSRSWKPAIREGYSGGICGEPREIWTGFSPSSVLKPSTTNNHSNNVPWSSVTASVVRDRLKQQVRTLSQPRSSAGISTLSPSLDPKGVNRFWLHKYTEARYSIYSSVNQWWLLTQIRE